MTGRDLIIYILSNNLENEQIFKDGKFIGFITTSEAAEKLGVGVATIRVLFEQGRLHGVTIGQEIYISDNLDSSPSIPRKE